MFHTQIEHWLERSKSVPFIVAFYLAEVFDILEPHSERIKYVDIIDVTWPELATLSAYVFNSLHSLSVL
jgi:hypothetical protein